MHDLISPPVASIRNVLFIGRGSEIFFDTGTKIRNGKPKEAHNSMEQVLLKLKLLTD
jgi:hypothetical protein